LGESQGNNQPLILRVRLAPLASIEYAMILSNVYEVADDQRQNEDIIGIMRLISRATQMDASERPVQRRRWQCVSGGSMCAGGWIQEKLELRKTGAGGLGS
jgi:hypothetical protein